VNQVNKEARQTGNKKIMFNKKTAIVCAAVTVLSFGGITYPGTGNINANPLFTGGYISKPWNYYRLQADSPALASSSIGGAMEAQLEQSAFQIPKPTVLLLR
jgi:hypothetical protein